ncbi:alpha/beta fold hydrolase [Brevibacillus massiliensis]|jgi:proline iminopeptidase|uniref:alpha/beta fold hydrolase n=1 Tax=Brevibacillus massiliensis TaxID=1118054 RepID=UPI0003671592|nr:alpha/beta fold hydrolase [Brevibacillus massiliensis]
MFANVNGTRLFFDVEGVGYVPNGPALRQKPVCFVLHGGPGGDHTGFKPHMTPLSEWMQLVYIDNRGSGLSDRPHQSTYTLEQNVEDVEALREHLGLEKIVLLGHSYGGMVALCYAIKYPQHTSALLLVTTSPSYRFIERAKQILLEKATSEQQKMAQVLWEGAFESDEQLLQYYEVMEPLYAYSWNPNPSQEELRKRKDAQRRSKRNHEAINQGFKGFLKTFDVTDQLASISCPALIVSARHDWITPVEESLVLAEKIPDNELVIFEKSSHSVFRDEYERFIETISSFVKRKLVDRLI